MNFGILGFIIDFHIFKASFSNLYPAMKSRRLKNFRQLKKWQLRVCQVSKLQKLFCLRQLPGLEDLTLCSMILEIRSSDSVVYEEFPLYPLNLLISDIGGIAGLVMGINLIHIISIRASTDFWMSKNSSCWKLSYESVIRHRSSILKMPSESAVGSFDVNGCIFSAHSSKKVHKFPYCTEMTNKFLWQKTNLQKLNIKLSNSR